MNWPILEKPITQRVESFSFSVFNCPTFEYLVLRLQTTGTWHQPFQTWRFNLGKTTEGHLKTTQLQDLTILKMVVLTTKCRRYLSPRNMCHGEQFMHSWPPKAISALCGWHLNGNQPCAAELSGSIGDMGWSYSDEFPAVCSKDVSEGVQFLHRKMRWFFFGKRKWTPIFLVEFWGRAIYDHRSICCI